MSTWISDQIDNLEILAKIRVLKQSLHKVQVYSGHFEQLNFVHGANLENGGSKNRKNRNNKKCTLKKYLSEQIRVF